MTTSGRLPWDVLRAQFEASVKEDFSHYFPSDTSNYEINFRFALGRFDEGQQLAPFFLGRIQRRPVRVLDIGAGNGGVSVALANDPTYEVSAVDIVPNYDLFRLRRDLDSPVRQVVGNGHRLPFPDSSFDVVVCLDTIEHVPKPGIMAREIMRVLAPGGECMITTPARARILFAPDPHYGIRFLAALPNALARLWVLYVARPTVLSEEGVPTVVYEVEHLFWHVHEIARLFPGPKRVEPLFNNPLPYKNRFANAFWLKFRNFVWDRIVIIKK